ncbi:MULTISPECIES: AAA family ATPase [unclassified Bacteroides]|uniref:AAA family ATPase n=1 Tax=unclassified Bacteroides TaxID=2646097 RepID=UPI0004E15730|nr:MULTISPECIES: AAA family ATPase [unclassified Bacteroides]
MNKDVITNLKKMIDVNTPVIYIHDYDFTRVDFILKETLGPETEIREWSPAFGYQQIKQIKLDDELNLFRDEFAAGKDATLNDVLNTLLSEEYLKEPTYLLLRDIHELIDDIETKSLIQMLAQRKLYDLDFDLTIIINSSLLYVPKEIEKYVSFLEIPYPTDDEIKMLIKQHVDTNGYNKEFKDEHIKNLMPSLKGMTLFEIDRMLDMAMSSGGTLTDEDKEMILRHKKQMVKKSGILELVDSPEKISSIGGLENLKKYLEKKSKIIKNIGEAINAGVTVPKGVFIVGMPGCGKSLCAKATAALFECPLLKLDMGSLMGKYQGESEKNLRQAIKIAEAAAPCILWIDEIEKAFTGVGGSEVLTRMFGYFLSWMQEKTSSVYVLATANNAANLPPELKRKGRFDEIFCVKLPEDKERKQIFEVHLKKRKKEGINISDALIEATKGFNGADIESVVNEAVEDCFVNKKDLTDKILLDIAENTVSISKSCQKQIKDMDEIFEESKFKTA